MGLSTSELYLVLRARDEASRALRSFKDNLKDLDREAMQAAQSQFNRGQALATAGVAVAGAGLVGAAALNNMADAAANYNHEAALTLTQTDTVKTSLEELKDLGREVAREIPIPFEQIQTGLYDIFSSMDVTMEDAKMLIREFAKAGVAGNTDLQTASRGTIAVLNAFKMPAKDVVKVNDIMFQMVRKGVGTYDEFASSIGRAIPATVRAGQEFETLGGMMTFLTRNGLSTQMAATSAARALEAMAHPKTVKRLEEMGVKVRDANGEFRPMVDILGQMNEKFSKMTAPQRAEALQDLFKGAGGTIQARRFFDPLFQNFDEFEQRVGEMKGAAGAMGEAYDIMRNTPVSEIQLMTNKYEALKTEIGDQVLPIKLKLLQVLSMILSAFQALPAPIRENIGVIAAIATGLAILVGVVMSIAGLWLMFSAAVAMAGTTMAAVLTPVGLIIAGIVALIAVGVLVYKNWDTIAAVASRVWKQVWDAIQPVVKIIAEDLVKAGQAMWKYMQQIWNAMWPVIKGVVDSIVNGVQSFVKAIQPHLQQFVDMWPAISEAAMHVWNTIKWVAGRIWDILKPVIGVIAITIAGILGGLGGAIGPLLKGLGTTLGFLMDAIGALIGFVVHLINGDWKLAWQSAVNFVKATVGAIISLIMTLWTTVIGFVVGMVKGIIKFFTKLWDELVGHSIVPDIVNDIVDWISSLPDKVLKFITVLVAKVIFWFLSMHAKVASAVSGLVSSVLNWFGSLPGRVIGAVASLASRLYSTARNWVQNAINGVNGMIGRLIGLFSNLPSRIISAMGWVGGKLWSAGRDLIQGMINGVASMAGRIADKAKDVVSGAVTAAKRFLGIASPSKVFDYIGQMTGAGMVRGMNKMMGAVASAGTDLAAASLTGTAPVVSGAVGTGLTANDGSAGKTIEQNITIHTQEIDPRKHAADLGWELAVLV